MESPEKRNANSNEGPTCCQAGFSNNFQRLGNPPRGGAIKAVYLAQSTQRVASGMAFSLAGAIGLPQAPQNP
jgi:hypothetical protein